MNMKHRKPHKGGQSTAEYAIVISVVIAVAVGMQLYVKRGLQAKFKGGADHYTEVGGNMNGLEGLNVVGNITRTRQYEPYYTANGTMATNSNSSRRVNAQAGGQLNVNDIFEQTTRSGLTSTGTGLNRDADKDWQ